jgi:hypothetical protein
MKKEKEKEKRKENVDRSTSTNEGKSCSEDTKTMRGVYKGFGAIHSRRVECSVAKRLLRTNLKKVHHSGC